jgi:hypothetical protein
VWRRRSTGNVVVVSQQIDEYFDQRVNWLLRVRAQVWAGCSRFAYCYYSLLLSFKFIIIK